MRKYDEEEEEMEKKRRKAGADRSLVQSPVITVFKSTAVPLSS